MRVLAVEDDAPIRHLLVSALGRAGLQVISARDGAEALELLGKERYAVLLLDLMMPRMSGWDVIDWLKSHPERRPRTVVVLTAGKPDMIKPVPAAAVDAIVFKPFDLHELTACVKGFCAGERQRPAGVSAVSGDPPQERRVDADHP